MQGVVTSQPRTNLGPLTTIFTPKPRCNHFVGLCPTCAIAWLSETCVKTGPQDDASCWPPTRSGAASPSPTLNGWGFYSPGLVCPSGFTSACTATAGGKSEWPVQFLMTAGETAVGCCPSGFNCANIKGATCTVVPISTTVPIVTCNNGTSGALSYLKISEVQTRPTVFYAPLIQINWKPSDRPPAISATATSTTDPSTTATSTSPSSPGPSESGPLPRGAIAGIVAGCVAIVFFIALAVYRIPLAISHHNNYYNGDHNEYHNNNNNGHQNSNHNNGHQHSYQSASRQNNNEGAGNQWNGNVDADRPHPGAPE